MRALLLLAFIFLSYPAVADDSVAMLSGPQVAIPNPKRPAPHMIAIVQCVVDDLGLTNLPPEVIPSPQWHNLGWHTDKSGNLECKRIVVEIQDKDEMINGSQPLNANFGDPGQCAKAAALFMTTTQWDEHHKQWAVIAVGCPTPITNPDGFIIGWHVPECPSHVPGNPAMPLRCNYDDSAI